MKDEDLVSIAFPGDTYQKILQEVEELDAPNIDETSIMIGKFIEFNMSLLFQLACIADAYTDDLKFHLFNGDIKLVKPKDLVSLIFLPDNLNSILIFLDKYDNTYFWDAFGISLEKGNTFLEKMSSFSENPDVFTEIITEVVNSGKLKKDIIANELFYYIFFKNKIINDDILEIISDLMYVYFQVASKYSSVNDALSLSFDEKKCPIIDIHFIKQIINVFQKDDELSPKTLFAIIRCADLLCRKSRFIEIIQHILINEKNALKIILLNSFRMHRYGYQAYQVYLSECKARGWNPVLEIGNNPECYFYRSYKVPQIKSLYNRYFTTLAETEAKEKTRTCFILIYNRLKEAGFLDPECNRDEFLWAFSLIDEYPFAFKKIKFYTLSGRSKKEKGNGAFLCLLNILGYKKDEIAQLLHRNPEFSEINKTFDLSMQDKTKPSKDHEKLLEIVTSSGLPIK